LSDEGPHALYEGWVAHRRFTPVHHAFRYRIWLVSLDLERIDEAFQGRWRWSHTRPAIGWFRREDHFGDPGEPLLDSVRTLLRHSGIRADGPVRLLTQLRHFGFVMNPVSFYYCYESDGQRLSAVVAEVHNTPWGERHCYVLPTAGAVGSEAWLEKQFHVSPFMPIDQRYRWRLSAPSDVLRVRIENHDHRGHVFTAALRLERRAWNTCNLQRLLWRQPFMTQRVFAGIYWQAFKLWWKGSKYFPHPGRLREESETPKELACEHRT
jgi:uncharacterized protein